jgi:hypothetical protein
MDLVTTVVVATVVVEESKAACRCPEKQARSAEGPTQIYPRSRKLRRRYGRPRTAGRGESNLPLKAAGANMVWPNEGRWEVGRVGSRRARDSSVEVWGERSARSRSGTISFTWDQADLSASESVEMEAIIEKPLNGQIWRELYVSREFMVQNTDRTMRGVADLSHLSDHYDSIVTKAETLEGFSASLMPGDRMLSMDLRSRYNYFRLHPDMRKYFTVGIVTADGTDRYCHLCFHFDGAVLAIGSRDSAEILDYGQEDARLSCFELCQRLRDCSISRPPCIIGRLSKSVTAFGCASFALWFDKAPSKGCLGRWVPVSTTSRFCGGYSQRVVWNPSEEVGCDFELCQAVAEDGSTQPQAREGGLSGDFYRQSSEYATGRARHGVPPQSPLRLRTSEDDGFDAFDVSRETMPDFHLCCACIPSGFERSGIWRDLPNLLHHRPIWREVSKQTVTIHTDASMTAHGATLALREQEAGAKGFYECRGYREGSQLNKAHITLLELAIVRLCLKDFLQHWVLRQNAVIKLYTDNMVTMFGVNKWVSKSPVIMAELRRLHQFCKRHGLELELHHLPSALNLYADRLSRRLQPVRVFGLGF